MNVPARKRNSGVPASAPRGACAEGAKRPVHPPFRSVRSRSAPRNEATQQWHSVREGKGGVTRRGEPVQADPVSFGERGGGVSTSGKYEELDFVQLPGRSTEGWGETLSRSARRKESVERAPAEPTNLLRVDNTSAAFKGLPEAVQVESTEDAKAILQKWELWSQQMQQQLTLETSAPLHPVILRGSQRASTPRPFSSRASSVTGPEGGLWTPVGESIVGRPSPRDTNDKQRVAPIRVPSRGRSVSQGSRSRCSSVGSEGVMPFRAGERSTASAERRRIHPQSTRKSRELLFRRALELEPVKPRPGSSMVSASPLVYSRAPPPPQPEESPSPKQPLVPAKRTAESRGAEQRRVEEQQQLCDEEFYARTRLWVRGMERLQALQRSLVQSALNPVKRTILSPAEDTKPAAEADVSPAAETVAVGDVPGRAHSESAWEHLCTAAAHMEQRRLSVTRKTFFWKWLQCTRHSHTQVAKVEGATSEREVGAPVMSQREQEGNSVKALSGGQADGQLLEKLPSTDVTVEAEAASLNPPGSRHERKDEDQQLKPQLPGDTEEDLDQRPSSRGHGIKRGEGLLEAPTPPSEPWETILWVEHHVEDDEASTCGVLPVLREDAAQPSYANWDEAKIRFPPQALVDEQPCAPSRKAVTTARSVL